MISPSIKREGLRILSLLITRHIVGSLSLVELSSSFAKRYSAFGLQVSLRWFDPMKTNDKDSWKKSLGRGLAYPPFLVMNTSCATVHHGPERIPEKAQLLQQDPRQPGLQPGFWSARGYSPSFVCLLHRADLQTLDGLQGGLGCCPEPARSVPLTGGSQQPP